MAGTHYTLDRDCKEPEPPKEKPCKRCGKVKPNDFVHFGKKWKGNRTTYVTNDVCAQCKHDKHMATLAEKRKLDREYAEFKHQQFLELVKKNQKQ